MDIGLAACLLHLLNTCMHIGIHEIFPDGAVEQIGILGDNADIPSQKFEIKSAHINAVESHGARCDIIKTGNQIDHGRFAGTGRTDDGNRMAALQIEADILEDHPLRIVAEEDMREFNIALCLFRCDGIGCVFNFHRHVIVAEDSCEVGHCPDPLHLDVEQ